MSLVNDALNGNEQAKLKLIASCKDVMDFAIATYQEKFRGYLDKGDIEDLVTECYIAILECIPLFREEMNCQFHNFAKLRIRQRIINFLDRKARHNSPELDVASKSGLLNRPKPLSPDTFNIVYKNERDKRVCELFMMCGSYTDVANELGISRQRVFQIIHECFR